MTQCSTHYHKHTLVYTQYAALCTDAKTQGHLFTVKVSSMTFKMTNLRLRLQPWTFMFGSLLSHSWGWILLTCFFLVEKYILHRTLPLYQSSLILGNSNCSQRSLSKVVGGGKRKRHLNTSPLRQDLATRQTSWQRSQAVISGLIRPSLYVNE